MKLGQFGRKFTSLYSYCNKVKESPFSAVFSNFAQQFSYDNLKKVTDQPKKGRH